MLNGKTVAVVVPCYNEETQIGMVIETMPDFVDRIIVVNDNSTDKTAEVALKYISHDKTSVMEIPKTNFELIENRYNKAEFVANQMIEDNFKKMTPSEIVNKNHEKSRIVLINHLVNASVGAAIATGYKWCLDHNIYCTAVMAGDGQMDPAELSDICQPIINGSVDYVKSNRLSHRSAQLVVPTIRFFGNSVLSLLTKMASGYWKVSDTQSGYTAISLKGLKAIDIPDIYPTYGCPNDILVKLNISYCTIKEIPTKPIYNVGEKSKMKEFRVIPKISWLLFKSFWKRLYLKYLFRDFHPLFLLYHLAFTLLLIDTIFMYRVLYSLLTKTYLSDQSTMAFIFLTISGFQSMFFAMWMDMLDNERLYQ